MVCSFGKVVLCAAVFDCHIVNRRLSKQFIASLNDALQQGRTFPPVATDATLVRRIVYLDTRSPSRTLVNFFQL
ncbi:hypothetical protein BLNAU_18990 [Blattamonas nauphoetae]|uniref:Uncharacterized protein n=1 Tax=Blattamonas nauphoetae TaxID=2049346 RepID=A0ABQ9X2T4_9EUKA|nr:hypothetical protein BLNAU_18990 [Blattamonas nauphoetae]